MKAGYVLDASALLAWLFREPGAATVTQILGKGTVISSLNWSEALQKLLQRGILPEQACKDLQERQILGKAITILPFNQLDAEETARLYPTTSSLGLSLADRACLVLARRLAVPAVTADRIWANLVMPELKIEVIR